jgi:hypothetical protein
MQAREKLRPLELLTPIGPQSLGNYILMIAVPWKRARCSCDLHSSLFKWKLRTILRAVELFSKNVEQYFTGQAPAIDKPKIKIPMPYDHAKPRFTRRSSASPLKDRRGSSFGIHISEDANALPSIARLNGIEVHPFAILRRLAIVVLSENLNVAVRNFGQREQPGPCRSSEGSIC